MDRALLLLIHRLSCPPLDSFFLLSDLVGQVSVFAVLVIGVSLSLVLRRRWREGLSWILIGIWTIAFLQLLKVAVGRPRPQLWAPLIQVGGYSFPSGHALAAATLYPLLAYEMGRGGRLAFLIAALGSLWLGLGRLYLGVHWPSDVLFGWGLGALQSLAGLQWLRRQQRDKNPLAGRQTSGEEP